MTTKDRAYPFPDRHNTAKACIETYGYTEPCAPALENAILVASRTFFVVILSSLITKVCHCQFCWQQVVFAYAVILYKTEETFYPEIIEELFDHQPKLDSQRDHERCTENTPLLTSDGWPQNCRQLDGLFTPRRRYKSASYRWRETRHQADKNIYIEVVLERRINEMSGEAIYWAIMLTKKGNQLYSWFMHETSIIFAYRARSFFHLFQAYYSPKSPWSPPSRLTPPINTIEGVLAY